jgi:hypothetical protein
MNTPNDQRTLTLVHIVEVWIQRLQAGAIHYQPSQVLSRVVSSEIGKGFQVILNTGRHRRPEKKAA